MIFLKISPRFLPVSLAGVRIRGGGTEYICPTGMCRFSGYRFRLFLSRTVHHLKAKILELVEKFFSWAHPRTNLGQVPPPPWGRDVDHYGFLYLSTRNTAVAPMGHRTKYTDYAPNSVPKGIPGNGSQTHTVSDPLPPSPTNGESPP